MPIDALSQLQGLPTTPQFQQQKSGSSLRNFFMGTPARAQQFPRFSPFQMGAQNYLLQQGLQNVDPEALKRQAEDRFYKKTVPTLAERFTAMGAGGQASSAFQGALGEAGAGLETDLAALQSNLGLQMLLQGLQPQYETMYQPRTPGFFGNLLSSFASRAPQMASSYFGLGGL